MNKRSALFFLNSMKTMVFFCCLSSFVSSKGYAHSSKEPLDHASSDVAQVGFFWGRKGDDKATLEMLSQGSLERLLSGQQNQTLGNFFAGYGFAMPYLYISGQLFTESPSFERTIIRSERQHLSLSRKFTYGTSLSVGTPFLKDTIGYLKLGIDVTCFQQKLYTMTNASPVASASSHQIAFTPGLGIRTMISPKFFVQVDYKYSFYPKSPLKNPSTTVSPSHKTYPKSQSLMIGAGIKF